MNFDRYRAIPAVNFSTLKAMALSPLHYRHASTHPRDDTDRMRCGRLNHAMIADPETDWPSWEGQRRAGKAWDEFRAASGSDYIWKPEELDAAHALRDAIRSHKATRDLLLGESEVVCTWVDPATQICCKGRMDLLGLAGIVEFKFIADISKHGIKKAIGGYKYHAQAAMYLAGAKEGPFTWIFAEAAPPHDVVVVKLSDNLRKSGAALYQSWLARVAECRESDDWPGTAPDPIEIDELLPWDEAPIDEEPITMGGERMEF